MFFRRASKAETKPAATVTELDAGKKTPSTSAAAGAREEKTPSFKTTADLEPASGPIGQERALEALDFGLAMRGTGFNILVSGAPGSGRRRAVKERVAAHMAKAATPADWAYVANFEDPYRPRALKLPHGRARALAAAMTDAVTELSATLPAAFASEDYQARRSAIDEELRYAHDDALEELIRTAAAQNIAVRRTAHGYAMAPMLEGRVVKAEVFNQLPEAMRREVEARVGAFEKRLETILAEAPQSEKERRRRLARLDEEVAAIAVAAALEEATATFADVSPAAAFLAAAAHDLVRNRALFLDSARADGGVRSPAETARDPRLRRYMVDVMATRDGDGAAVVEETAASLAAIVGRIERTPAGEALFVRPGALHTANGGILILDARQLLQAPAAWEALKRALATGKVRIEPAGDGVVGEQVLEPEAIPLDLKVVLIADDASAVQLKSDAELARLFKVEAQFETRAKRTAESEASYARVIAAIVAEHGLKPVDAAGVTRLIDEAGKLAGTAEMLTLETDRVADIAREADHWSGVAKRTVTTAEDVTRALAERERRAPGASEAAPTEGAGAASVPLPFAKSTAKGGDRPRLSKVAL